MTKFNSNLFFILVILLLLGFLTACGQTIQVEKSTKEQLEIDSDAIETVTIENLGRTITFEEPPKRAVAINSHVIEIMLALGLEDSLVGKAFSEADPLPDFKDAYEKVPVLTEQYPSQEVLLGVDPDFVYAGYQSAFTDRGVGSVEGIEEFGIKAYIQQSTTMNEPTMEDVFTDILNIGRIFRVEDRAEKLVTDMKEKMNDIHEKVGDVEEPIRVFVYDGGEKDSYTAAQNILKQLISLAGGTNVFGDIEKGWATVSWEEVVDRDPEMIVIMDYGDKTFEQKKNFLLNHPPLSDVTAIKEERFAVLPLIAAEEGIRGPMALEELAKSFYPDAFE